MIRVYFTRKDPQLPDWDFAESGCLWKTLNMGIKEMYTTTRKNATGKC